MEACPVCEAPNAVARDDDDFQTVQISCGRCKAFTITPSAIVSIRQYRRSGDPELLAEIGRLAAHLASGRKPRPVIMETNWTAIAP